MWHSGLQAIGALMTLQAIQVPAPPRGFSPAAAEVVPQFYHLYPATLGFLGRLAGQAAMTNLNPLLAVVSVLGVYLLGRRLAGVAAGVVAAAVLGVSMMQVWLAKYPTTEISGPWRPSVLFSITRSPSRAGQRRYH